MLHKIVLGGEWLLPYALSSIKKLRANGAQYASRNETIDGVEMLLRCVGPHDYVYLRSTASYEFFCSDPGATLTGIPGNGQLYTDSDPFSITDRVMTGCGVRYKVGAIFSNTLKPDAVKQTSWRMVPLPKGEFALGLPEQVVFKTGNDFFPSTGSAWQAQKMTESVWRYKNTSGTFVTSCLGVGMGQSFLAQQNWLGVTVIPKSQLLADGFTQGYAAATNGGIWFSSYPTAGTVGRASGFRELTDAWDVPPSVFTSAGSIAAGSKRSPLANWRRAAIQKHIVGGVEVTYIISSDKHGGFSAYLAKDYGVDYADIPTAEVQVSIPDYPSWVTVPALGDEAKDHWVFSFNKDATLATSTPFERVPAYLWVGSEDIDLGNLSSQMRSVLPGDGGVAPYYPVSGTQWPLESALPPATVFEYKVQRERLYIETSPYGSGAHGVHVQGRFHALHRGRTRAGFFAGAGITEVESEENAANYEPAFLCKPGFIEVSLVITPTDPNNPSSFTFAATVVQEESWSSQKRFYLDCGYFAPDKRTNKPALAEGLAEDVLLTAELEVFVRNPDGVVRFHDAGVDARAAKHSERGTLFPVFAEHYNATLADEPNCEGSLIAAYRGDIEVFYVVRERTTQKEVRRFCLARNIDWFANSVKPVGSTTLYTAGPTTVTGVAYADLRTLSFITRSFSLKTGAFYTGPNAGRVSAQLWELGPRYELRMLGNTLRTISYADPALHGYAGGADPVTDAGASPGFFKLPTGYSAPAGGSTHGTGAPDSFLLAVQLWAQTSLVEPCASRSINTHPDGHWSTYVNTDGEGRTFQSADSTEPNEVFDIIKPAGGAGTTHKAEFNAAFSQNRSHAAYAGVGEAGGFCTFGIWADKNTKGY